MIERLKAFLYRKFHGYDIEEYLIMSVTCSIFLPFYCSLIMIAVVLSYLGYKKRLPSILTHYPKAKYVYVFFIVMFLVSLFYQNELGAVCVLGMAMIFIFSLFYRIKINKRLFELIVDACCIISLFCFGWALLEYFRIIQSLDYEVLHVIVPDDPRYRVNSTFFNANYYAMMIEFLVLLCIYKMMRVKTKRRIVFYVITILCNLIGLYLSGCRSAWAPFIITIPLMFYLNRKMKFFAFTMGILACGGSILLWNPSLFPRYDSFWKYFLGRVKIWEVAWEGIRHQPLLGQGPLTYFHIYDRYGGPPTQHAHNIVLDPILSFGLLGIALLIPYFASCWKDIWSIYRTRCNIPLFSLILAFILTIVLHGMFDYTIFWIQTSQLFLLIFCSASMYAKQEKVK